MEAADQEGGKRRSRREGTGGAGGRETADKERWKRTADGAAWRSSRKGCETGWRDMIAGHYIDRTTGQGEIRDSELAGSTAQAGSQPD